MVAIMASKLQQDSPGKNQPLPPRWQTLGFLVFFLLDLVVFSDSELKCSFPLNSFLKCFPSLASKALIYPVLLLRKERQNVSLWEKALVSFVTRVCACMHQCEFILGLLYTHSLNDHIYFHLISFNNLLWVDDSQSVSAAITYFQNSRPIAPNAHWHLHLVTTNLSPPTPNWTHPCAPAHLIHELLSGYSCLRSPLPSLSSLRDIM